MFLLQCECHDGTQHLQNLRGRSTKWKIPSVWMHKVKIPKKFLVVEIQPFQLSKFDLSERLSFVAVQKRIPKCPDILFFYKLTNKVKCKKNVFSYRKDNTWVELVNRKRKNHSSQDTQPWNKFDFRRFRIQGKVVLLWVSTRAHAREKRKPKEMLTTWKNQFFFFNVK